MPAPAQSKLIAIIGKDCLPIAAMAEKLNWPVRRVAVYSGRLLSKGLIERTEIGCYRLTDEGAEVKKKGAVPASKHNRSGKWKWVPVNAKPVLRERIWSALRIKDNRPVTIDEIVILVGGEKVRRPARRYLRILHLAGYLILLNSVRSRKNQPKKVYVLKRNTGPMAPIWRRWSGNYVFDPNNSEKINLGGNHGK